MARLSKVLGSILRDAVAAQHEANMYALRLSAAYRNQGVFLNPPAASLGEMELMLHCGFTCEAVTGEMYETDPMKILHAVRGLSSEISESMATCILSTIIRHSGGHEERPIARLNKEKSLRRNFIAFLNHQLYGYLKSHQAEFVQPDGGIDMERLQEAVLFVADDMVLSHSDMEEVFARDAAGQLAKAVREELRTHVEIMLPRILKDIRICERINYASLDVLVSSEELAQLPDGCIQTFRLKISPHELPLGADTE